MLSFLFHTPKENLTLSLSVAKKRLKFFSRFQFILKYFFYILPSFAYYELVSVQLFIITSIQTEDDDDNEKKKRETEEVQLCSVHRELKLSAIPCLEHA